jgi:hypothetical protein
MRINAETHAGRNTPARELEIHIEEVVLRNFSPGDRSHIGDAFESELANLVKQHGLSTTTSSISIDRLDAGSFKVAPGAKAQTVGGQVAKALFGQLSPASQKRSAEIKPKTQRTGS